MSAAGIEGESLRHTRTSVIPASEDAWKAMRALDITSTESSGLFGMSPYKDVTPLGLYHRKRNKEIVDIEMNDRMLWGKRMERTIAEGLGEDNGVIVRPLPQYVRIPEARMGASFDFEIVGVITSEEQRAKIAIGADPERSVLQRMFIEHGPGLFEIKATGYVEFRDNWTKNDDKTIEAPGHIETQLQHQLHVIDSYKWGAIGVLVAGNTPKLTARLRDLEVGAALQAAVERFWSDVDAGNEPAPHYPADADRVRTLNSKIIDGTIFDGRNDPALDALCEQYRAGLDKENSGKSKKESAMAEIARHIGTADRALVDGWTISSWIVGDTFVEAHTRAGGRRFKITRKKAK